MKKLQCKKNVKLVSFLYELMRDRVPAGVVEGIVAQDEQNNTGYKTLTMSNGHLGRYAQDLAERLTGEQAMPTRDIGWAIRGMKGDGKFRRAGWNGKGVWIALYRPTVSLLPDPEHDMTLPYIYMMVQGERVPWIPSQADLLAGDWEEIMQRVKDV